MMINKHNGRHFAAIAQALADGKPVQYRIKTDDSWVTVDNVNTDALHRWPDRFRVKPDTIKVITVLGPTASYVFDSRHYNDAEAAAMSYCARNKINYQQHARLNEFEV